MRQAIGVFCGIALLAGGCSEQISYYRATTAAGETGGADQCDFADRAAGFSITFPDNERILYAKAFVTGDGQSLVVIYGKSFTAGPMGYWTEAGHRELDARTARDAAWISDRSKPFSFSSNEIRFTWQGGGHASYVIPGFVPRGDRFEAMPNANRVVVPFEFQPVLPAFGGDWIEVTLPSVGYDGVTVATAPVRFTRTTGNVLVPWNC